jgi:hypothetical protein
LLRDHDWSHAGARLTLRIALTSLFMFAPHLAVTTAVSAERSDISSEFEKCRMLWDDQARLACLKNLITKAPDESSAAGDAWPLIRTPNPRGGPDAVSTMRTADTSRSDADLAGLMIRCAERPGLETLLALVRPLRPHSTPEVVVALGPTQVVLHAGATPAGTALVLPVEASTFTIGPWRNAKEISVTIKDPDGEITGVIQLSGIAAALAKLSASCPSR